MVAASQPGSAAGSAAAQLLYQQEPHGLPDVLGVLAVQLIPTQIDQTSGA